MNLVLCFSKPVLAAKRAEGVEAGSSNLKTLSLTTPAQQQATRKIRDEKVPCLQPMARL